MWKEYFCICGLLTAVRRNQLKKNLGVVCVPQAELTVITCIERVDDNPVQKQVSARLMSRASLTTQNSTKYSEKVRVNRTKMHTKSEISDGV